MRPTQFLIFMGILNTILNVFVQFEYAWLECLTVGFISGWEADRCTIWINKIIRNE